ncbi:MAG: metal-dependent hydrolase [Anaerosolibacter sp.]|jgi:inner membrane protein|uniref:metal-dependent hydrolase n=1 Tax=Anaerosolibacter sp. TaxID=1872527 RepID=UPI00261F6D2C|nr:metal-dependent hydrolase [Anaerosolibacter sp.]MDF2547008.1 metal-dependent hydrolase [Anaerosolibacter sp.]
MDPVTHGVIGLAISAFSGNPVALSNPVSLGCAIGAMAPDIDIIGKMWGDFVYLKHHRGITHSIPVLVGLAAIITGGLSFFYADFSSLQVFFWTFVGCLSHTLFDILNSYGAKLLMPFTKKKSKIGILMLYDPVITVLAFLLIFNKQNTPWFLLLVSSIFILYLGSRWLIKQQLMKFIEIYYSHGYKVVNVEMLPALLAFYKWDFIVNTNSHNIVGQINMMTKKITERKKFKRPDQETIELFEETNIGKYFKDFSTNYHILRANEGDQIVLKSIDLRYFLKNNFMHHATVIYDRERNIRHSFFHPYKIQRRILVSEVE